MPRIMFRVSLLLVLVVSICACDQTNYDRIETLAEEGNIDALLKIVTSTDTDQHFRLNAAWNMADLVNSDMAKHDQYETVLQTLRDEAKTLNPSDFYVFKQALSFLNEQTITEVNAKFLALAQAEIETYREQEAQVALEEGNVVDGIIANKGVLESSSIDGLTVSEINDYVKQLSLVGVILRRDILIGTYECGTAKQINYDLYLVDLKERTVEGSISIEGGMPPRTIQGVGVIPSHECSRTGTKPEYEPYFQVHFDTD